VEAAVVLLLAGVAFLAVVSPVLTISALVRLTRLEKRVSELASRVERARRGGVVPEGLADANEPVPPAPATPAPTVTPSPPPVRPVARAAPRPGPSAEPTADFATNLGPRILVGAGGLAVVVFLALFVRYAWENEWVGPMGRVLSGAVFGLGLVAAGLRLLDGKYRPLGQGLAAAGFAGLYVSAFAAHSFYDLVPRGLSGVVMVVVTVCAVAVADLRGTRLLAAVAWVGGYLTPALLSTGTDRGASLMLYLVLLGAGAVWLDRRKPWPETLPLALFGTLVLYLSWCEAHYADPRFEVAAVGLLSLSALFTLGTARKERTTTFDTLLLAVTLTVGALVSVGLASATDRPMALLWLLVAQLGLAVLVRPRWSWAEAATLFLGALAVLVWFDQEFEAPRSAEALALALGLAGTAVVVLAVRGLLLRRPLTAPDGVTQILAAGLSWVALDRVLDVTQPALLGPAAVALAALHLVLGLAARRQVSAQQLWTRVTLALAAVFLTLAIPVQLGLFGITLAWAGEALVLLWLGERNNSRLARAGGYGVMFLAVGRLLVRHLPLHSTPFTPVLNPAFATWLLVIAAVVLAGRLVSPARRRGSKLDVLAGGLLAPLGLVLLFGLVTAETGEFFDQRARAAREAAQPGLAALAARQGGLAVSVLWTVFATGLLAAGLGVRSRGLFYAAYGLFAVTAMKVVTIDLETLPTLYRMLSFLALGVLLLVGAWLNIRFRERLAPPGGGS